MEVGILISMKKEIIIYNVL